MKTFMREEMRRGHAFLLILSTVLASLALVGCLAGCSLSRAGVGNTGDEGASGLAASFPSDTTADIQAVAVEHTELHETVQTHTVKSPRLAQEIYEAYLRGEVGEVTDVWTTDYDDILTFTLSDGSTLVAEFNGHNLRDGDDLRTFDDKGGLWNMLAEMD